MSNYKKVFSLILIISNVVFGILFFKYYNKHKEQILFSKYQNKQEKKYQEKLNYRNFKVYNEVFNKKNYSIYKECFNYEYMEHPVDAYLLANTYYNLTKKSDVLKDIDLAKRQLADIYNED
ncbi:hypothetical protein [Flavobacterium oreochromis]|uniref:Uncharacterized protein n=1 Tax=Flavobacterium columnare TaxID=996 RepID=A0A2D0AHF7_9FLAO|nr:hypothetical protein [Flavobacterium oreochromis]OWP73986.1 hypothetical protein BWK62_15365 [Flavobacterium oreochromis]QYS85988.1 hypothetical protein JJC03_13235 [Flavobacterium oreochromis]